MGQSKIRSFTDLKAWQSAHKLAVSTYEKTKTFPTHEIYSLTNQMRRSVASVTANIAEGFGRQGYKDKVKFYYIAQGSLTELKDQLLLAKDLKYLKNPNFQKLAEQANEAHKILQGLITKSKSFLKS